MICEVCKTDVKVPQSHHWEVKGITIIKEVCLVCNRVLGAAGLWTDSSWEEQVEYLVDYYKKISRAEVEVVVLAELHRGAVTRKRVSAYLRLHKEIDVVKFLRYANSCRTRLEKTVPTTTSKEDLQLRELRKHPRLNRVELNSFCFDVIKHSEQRVGVLVWKCVRKHYKLGADLPSIEAIEFYKARLDRDSNTQRLLGGRENHKKKYKEQQEIRAWIKAHPEEANRILEKSKS